MELNTKAEQLEQNSRWMHLSSEYVYFYLEGMNILKI